MVLEYFLVSGGTFWVGKILHSLKPQDHEVHSLAEGGGGTLHTHTHKGREGKIRKHETWGGMGAYRKGTGREGFLRQ